MPEEGKEPTDDPPRPSPKPAKQSSKHVRVGPVELEDPTVVEWDPEERFHRYAEEMATGRFKTVYRAYDTENGIDVAWCKVRTAEGDPSPNDALTRIYREMKKGLALDHPSIVRCFACWLDRSKSCINLITELFTSGTLRAYRQAYSNVDLNVYRKYVRQLLQGLEYLHAQTPPIVHADLKLDKIYVNGFNAEVKIGDLGLTTLITKHYDSSKPPVVDSPGKDMLALGLCVYELLTGIPLDRANTPSTFRENLSLSKIVDKDAQDFVTQCLDTDNPLSAHALLEHQFLKSQTTEFKVKNGGEWDLGRVESMNQSIETKLRGEDWNFAFQGYESDNDETSLHIRLTMSNETETEHVTVLDFDYNLETDTPDSVGCDIADSFQLSSTDRELCTAALKEWLAVMSASKRDGSPPP